MSSVSLSAGDVENRYLHSNLRQGRMLRAGVRGWVKRKPDQAKSVISSQTRKSKLAQRGKTNSRVSTNKHIEKHEDREDDGCVGLG